GGGINCRRNFRRRGSSRRSQYNEVLHSVAGGSVRIVHALDVTGDRVRRRSLEPLSGGAMSAGAVVEQLQVEFGISQPAVSQHLTLLRETGFVGVEAAGRRRLYRLLPERFEQIGDWLEQFAAVNNSARSAPTRPAQPGTAPTRPAPTQVLFGPRALGALEALET